MELQKKLLGTWISDRKRTLQLCASYHNPKFKKKRKVLSSMFGKLELKFTKKHIHSTYDGDFLGKEKYKVLDQAEDSLVLKYKDTMWAEALETEATDQYVIISFEESKKYELIYICYSTTRWIECFRRPKPQK